MKRFLLPFLLLALVACSQTDTSEDGEILAEEQYRIVTGTKDLVDPIHGKRTGFWYGAVTGESANGVAYMHVFEDGASFASLNLNVGLAPKGSVYIASLTDGAGKSIELGELSSILGDARHTVSLDTEEDLSTLLNVQVHLATGSDRTLVGEGTLKQPPAGTW